VAEGGTCTIGRIGVSTAGGGDGATFSEPVSINQSGDAFTLSGLQQESSLIRTQWVRDQLLGLLDPGAEPVVPCTFTSYPMLDGFYRLNNVTANRTPAAIEWSIDMQRIRSWGHPRVEILTPYGLVPNVHGVTTGSIVVVPPGTPATWFGGGSSHYTARPNADGFNHDVWAQTGTTADTMHGYLNSVPSEWYKGGCRAQLNLASGGTYYTVVGRRSFADPVDLARFRISNGLVRVTGAGSTFAPQWWDGSSWESVQNWTLSDVTFGTITTGVGGFGILRNSPEEVAFRVTASVALGSGTYPIYIDFSIRRGVRVLVGYVFSYGGTRLRLTAGSAPAQTAITGGLRDTSNAADGNRYLFVSNNASTIDAANKRIQQPDTSVPSMLFGVSAEIGGTGATTGNGYVDQYGEFFVQGSDLAIVAPL